MAGRKPTPSAPDPGSPRPDDGGAVGNPQPGDSSGDAGGSESSSPSEKATKPVWPIYCQAIAVPLVLLSFVTFCNLLNTPPLELDARRDAAAKTFAARLAVTPDPELKANNVKLEVLKLEVQKQSAEIAQDLQETYDWYHFDFILTGAIASAFLGLLGAALRAQQPSKPGDDPKSKLPTFRRELRREVACVGMAIAAVIASVIDTHVLIITTNMQKVGLWISSVVEPVSRLSDLGWESWLREPSRYTNTSDALGSPGHEGGLSKYLSNCQVPPIHIVTWTMLSLFFFVSGIMVADAFKNGTRRKQARRLTLFLLVFSVLFIAQVAMEAAAVSTPLGFVRLLDRRPMDGGEMVSHFSMYLLGLAGLTIFATGGYGFIQAKLAPPLEDTASAEPAAAPST